MRVEIYKESEPKPAPEKVLRLVLLPSLYDDGNVRLLAVDEDGVRLCKGNIAEITSTGRLRRYFDVNPALGLELDDDGRIVMED